MLKEIRYLLCIVFVSLFFFFTGKYYFSNENIKNSHRSFNNINEKITIYSKKLPILENNTQDIIEYIKQTKQKKKKKFNFWKLLDND